MAESQTVTCSHCNDSCESYIKVGDNTGKKIIYCPPCNVVVSMARHMTESYGATYEKASANADKLFRDMLQYLTHEKGWTPPDVYMPGAPDRIEAQSDIANFGLYDCPQCSLKNQPGISVDSKPSQVMCMACYFGGLLERHPMVEAIFPDSEERKAFINLCMAQLYYQHQQSDIDFAAPIRKYAKQQQGDN